VQAVIVPRRSCLTDCVICQANKFIHSNCSDICERWRAERHSKVAFCRLASSQHASQPDDALPSGSVLLITHVKHLSMTTTAARPCWIHPGEPRTLTPSLNRIH